MFVNINVVGTSLDHYIHKYDLQITYLGILYTYVFCYYRCIVFVFFKHVFASHIYTYVGLREEGKPQDMTVRGKFPR